MPSPTERGTVRVPLPVEEAPAPSASASGTFRVPLPAEQAPAQAVDPMEARRAAQRRAQQAGAGEAPTEADPLAARRAAQRRAQQAAASEGAAHEGSGEVAAPSAFPAFP